MIRPATLEELPALVAGNLAMARETEGLELDEATLTEGVRAVLEGEQAGRYWVVEDQGAVVGQLLITFEWSDWRNRLVWWIQSVYVAPAFRRRGHYRALYARVIEQARRDGAAGIRLYVDRRNEAAQDVYAALGMDGEHYQVFERMFEPG